MMELREQIQGLVRDCRYSTIATSECVDQILAIPEISQGLKLMDMMNKLPATTLVKLPVAIRHIVLDKQVREFVQKPYKGEIDELP